LEGSGVGTLVHYPIPPHLQQAYADLGIPAGRLPLAERLAREVLSLPMGPHMRPEQVETVVEAIRAAVG
jgi:dTDP-3-amino-3,4,6-trideoxy-alpha-D-glucose transaminase